MFYHIIAPSPTDRLHLALCNLATATGKTLPPSAAGVKVPTPTRDSCYNGLDIRAGRHQSRKAARQKEEERKEKRMDWR